MVSLRSIHYGWIIVLSGMLTLIAVLGLGRFSLGMLLPSMGKDLELGYSQMGYIGTGNFIGYLLGVLACSKLVKRFGYRAVISSGIFLVGCSMILVGKANGFWLVLATFFFTGIGSGLGNVPVMGLVSHWFGSSLRGRAAGLMVSGIGLGIMITGLLIPAINNWTANGQGWRTNWIVMGVLVLAIGVLCSLLIRNQPQDLGLQVVEKEKVKKEVKQVNLLHKKTSIPAKRILLHLGSIYFFFGFTYVIYLTFVVTTLINEYGFSEAIAGRFWFWFGLFGIFSGPLFGSLSDRIGRARTLALVYGLQGISHLLLALSPVPGSVYLSIGLFALCAWSVPSIMAASVGDYLGPVKAASGFATVTLFFSIGQISGPALAGILAEKSGSFSNSYLMAGLLTATAALLSLTLPKIRE
jgi:MFS family permease